MKRILIFKLLLLFIGYSFSYESVYYVNSGSHVCNDLLKCGTIDNPFTTINDVLSSINYKHVDTSKGITILLSPGLYKGLSNKEITIDSFPLEIKSLGSRINTVIDCQKTSNFLIVNNSPLLTMEDITIQNCVSINGGGLYIGNSITSLKNIAIVNNNAYYGGAVYFKGGISTLDNVWIQDNSATLQGSGLYLTTHSMTFSSSFIGCNPGSNQNQDFYLVDSAIILENSNVTLVGATCSNSDFYPNPPKICDKKTSCPVGSIPAFQTIIPTTTTPYTLPCNNNGLCQPDLNEDCTTCPNDCPSCKFTGSLLEVYGGCTPQNYSTSCLVSVSAISQFSFEALNSNILPFYGKIVGYFDVSSYNNYKFHVISNNTGIKLSLNGKTLINSYYDVSKVDSFYEIPVASESLNFLSLEFVSYNTNLKSVFVEFKSSVDQQSSFLPISTIFSKYICGDGILDPKEKDNTTIYYCPMDIGSIQRDQVSCGDGVCNEVASECLRDCYRELSSSCPSQVRPIPLGENFKLNDFTSQLLNNQYMPSLPGLVHMAHGIDFLTGEERPFYLFDFGYCDNSSYSTIQDTYRGRVYNVPNDYYAEIQPQCSFDMSSSTFTSESEYSQEKSTESGLSASASVGGGIGAFSGSISAAYSESKSSREARSLSQSRDGSITSTVVSCFASKVVRKQIKFHEAFVRDISMVDTLSQMKDFIKSYGSLFFQTATLGGKLEVLSVTSKSAASTMSSSELSQNQAIAFSASVSTPFVSGSASYSQSMDSDVSSTSKSNYDFSTSKSQVLATGGAPGSYSPDGSGPSTYGEWAKTVDLVPMPIKYQVDFIGNIIPTSWKTPSGNFTKLLWFEALNSLYTNTTTSSVDAYQLSIYFKSPVNPSNFNSTLLNMTVVLTDSTGNADIASNNYAYITSNSRYTSFSFLRVNTLEVSSMQLYLSKNDTLVPFQSTLVDFIVITELVYGRSYYFNTTTNSTNSPVYNFNSIQTFINFDIDQNAISKLFTNPPYKPPILRVQLEATNGSYAQEYQLDSTNYSPLLKVNYDNQYQGHFYNATLSLFFDITPQDSLQKYNKILSYFTNINLFVLETCSDPLSPTDEGIDVYQLVCVPKSKYNLQPQGYINNYRTFGSTSVNQKAPFTLLDPNNYSTSFVYYLSR
ncbi:hypothetical protein DLAC_08439 [Tieghemostelium lacteum]|uniref:MACPF domain-containing protein n=1 Tax=Tieghemostelium lacteum TaxID=361077 RepID=A0A151ZBZ3_TIELA|nr:hypothetical protein DLAC_08439 [Tieghemostelium lacteum]|eukprot:KYQ91472.1 hypothetical protein DLAC_08439 [Tieghemostelium lacteum]